MNDYLAIARNDPPLAAAAIVFVVGSLGIAGFLFFQHIVGLFPCPLCLEQRMAFYFSVPLAGMLWLGASYGAARKVLFLGFLAIGAAMLWNTGLAVYHAGVEWQFWPGPQDCSGAFNNFASPADLLKQLQNTSLVRCDQAPWTFLGLSLAGWNVPLSLGLACVALWGSKAAFARRGQDN